MKSRTQINRYILIAVLVVLVSFGISLAFFVYRNYGVIARGVSGIALLFLLFFFGKRSNLDVSFEYLLLDPQKRKYLISALVVPMLSWFACAQIYEMILFFLR
jgi:uncharacterized membrane-anchored protein YitT (DUF2179 family)